MFTRHKLASVALCTIAAFGCGAEPAPPGQLDSSTTGPRQQALTASYTTEILSSLRATGHAFDINESGVVTGLSDSDGDIDHAVFWDSRGQLHDLDPGINDYGGGFGINAGGDIVGEFSDRAALYSGGTITNVEGFMRANAINDAGVIVGRGPFISRAGVATRLPTGGTSGEANAINGSDVVAGSVGAYGSRRAVIWDAAGYRIELGTLPGDVESVARSINNLGDVVGFSVDANRVSRAFLYRNGVMSDLLAEFNVSSSAAEDINNLGEVVGRMGRRAFVLSGAHLTDLHDIVGSASFTRAVAINDAGQIAGSRTGTTRVVEAFRLTPGGSGGGGDGEVPVEQDVDLAIDLQASKRVSTGSSFTYRARTSNAGPGTESAAELIVELSRRVRFSGVTSSQGSCILTSRDTVECQLGALAPGGVADVEVRVVAIRRGRAKTRVSVSGALNEVDSDDNSEKIKVRIR